MTEQQVLDYIDTSIQCESCGKRTHDWEVVGCVSYVDLIFWCNRCAERFWWPGVVLP